VSERQWHQLRQTDTNHQPKIFDSISLQGQAS